MKHWEHLVRLAKHVPLHTGYWAGSPNSWHRAATGICSGQEGHWKTSTQQLESRLAVAATSRPTMSN